MEETGIKPEEDVMEESSTSTQKETHQEKEEKTEERKQSESEEGQEKSQAPKKDASTRIKTLVAQKNIANEAYEKEKTLRLELEDKLSKSQLTEMKRPSRYDFETEESFEEAYDEYRDKKTEAQLNAIQSKDKANDIMQETLKAWQPCLDRANNLAPEMYPDLEEAFVSLDNVNQNFKYSDIMIDFIRTSTEGPNILYHLYKSPSEINKISGMPISEQAKVLINLEKETKKEVRNPSLIPPISPLGGRGTQDKSTSKMSAQEYYETQIKGRKKT